MRASLLGVSQPGRYSAAFEGEPVRIKVLVPMPVDAAFDYVARTPSPGPGTVLRVPLGRQSRLGVVWDASAPAARGTAVAPDKLKPIEAVLDIAPMREEMRRFVEWVAGYTLAPIGAVLRMALPPALLARPVPTQTCFAPGMAKPDRLTEARKRVLAIAAEDPPRTARALAEAAGVSESVVRGLAQIGALSPRERETDTSYPLPHPDRPGPKLSLEQAAAAEQLRKAVRTRRFAPILLEGVTGAGKTEVYFEAIAQTLRRPGAQVLVLLPEIALTSQWLERFETRFGARPVEWHSDLPQGERRRAWRRIAEGQARVVVGARSALFLPFVDLGLIIVDEEHDPSYKQEDGVLYNARDMAVVRGRIEGAPVVLSSATPSLETLANVERGRYAHLRLEDRHGPAELPEIAAIDLRRSPPGPGDWIAPALAEASTGALEAGEQILLFLNRRGYAPVTVCRACGARLECPNCTAWLVEHRYTARVQCHHCGFAMPRPERCAACGAEETLVPCGPGVERLAEEVVRRWPDARTAVMTSDTVTSPAKARQFVGRIESGEVDIIIGTQLITKGYHFPKLTVVGVVDADLGLRGGDLRAGERTFQQLMQVAGRAGRERHAGRVFLQTYDPDHPVTQALIAGDKRAFLEREAAARKRSGMPPYGRLAGLVVSGTDPATVGEAARRLAAAAPQAQGVSVYGPAPAPLARLRGRHRHRLLVQVRRNVDLQDYIRTWLRRAGRSPGVRLKVDIDPYSFL